MVDRIVIAILGMVLGGCITLILFACISTIPEIRDEEEAEQDDKTD